MKSSKATACKDAQMGGTAEVQLREAESKGP